MRPFTILLILLLSLPVTHAIGQVDSLDFNIKNVKYEPVTEDYFADYKGAKIIVNYYCSDGWSISDHYSYTVILVDSLLMLGFYSPETDGLRYISYEKKILLSSSITDSMEHMLNRAHLKQIKEGIPTPTAAANTKEVLIVKYRDLNIAGGMFYYNVLQEDASPKEINAMVSKERKLTSSIGGDYESIMKAMINLFPELKSLTQQVLKMKK
jgi:hypothetical protein